MSKLRVAVIGAKGRIGAEAARAVEAADDLDLVAAIDRDDRLETLTEADTQVAVDLTHPDAVTRESVQAIAQRLLKPEAIGLTLLGNLGPLKIKRDHLIC